MLNEHIEEIRKLAIKNNIRLIDALHHYMERNNLDPYFVADIAQSDKSFLAEIKKNARELKLVK